MNTASSASGSSHSELLSRALDAGKLDLPPRPELAAQLLQATTDNSLGSHQLTTIVKGDPGLTARVIQLANTSRWRGRRRIDTLPRAIARLGVRTLRETVLAVDLSRVYRAPGHERFATDIWHHSLATALYAREVSSRTGQHGDLAYTCGLLHSMGCAAALYQAAKLCRANRWSVSPDDMHRVVWDHAETAGMMLSREWDLPDPVRATITWAMVPHQALRHQELVQSVGLAAQLALLVTEGTGRATAPVEPLMASLGLSEADIEGCQGPPKLPSVGSGKLPTVSARSPTGVSPPPRLLSAAVVHPQRRGGWTCPSPS